MKKLFPCFLVLCLMFSGCASKQEAPQVEEPEETAPTVSPYYSMVMQSNTRPIAVMIDNDNKDAWPHAGLQDAYLVYEIIVEGGASRLMALFKDQSTAKIGPVRSSRHYFLDYEMEHDALYVHSGWSPKAQQDITSLGLDKINGVLSPGGEAFWRENKYTGDYHSLFTSMEKIQAFAKQQGFHNTTEKRVLNMAQHEYDLAQGNSAVKLVLPYSGNYKVSYEYNAQSKTYDRTMNTTAHITQEQVRVSPKNIIVQFAKNYPLPGDSQGKRQEVETMAGGTGYFVTNGKQIPITWHKGSRDAKTVYQTENGEEIKVNPGQTFIQIVPSSADISIE